MKNFIIGLVFFAIIFSVINTFVFAGSPTCTTVTNVTTGDSYTADVSDCVIKITRPQSFTSFNLYLPETGGTYTVQNGAELNTDYCADYGDEQSGPIIICQPRAITVFSLDSNNTVGNTQSDTMTDMYLQEDPHRASNTYTWNGVNNWDVDYGYLF